jgi:hypothetical protein
MQKVLIDQNLTPLDEQETKKNPYKEVLFVT